MANEKPAAINPGFNIKQLSFSDSINFDPKPRGILIKAQGDIVFVNDDDTTTTVASGELAAGIIHPLAPKRINSTSTTATVYGVY